jgi:membrane protease YdiL (CAAX protease family)
VCTILLLVLFFIPIIMLINALSFHLLGHLSPQEIVTTIIEEDQISYSQFFSILVLSPIIEELYFRKILLEELFQQIGSLMVDIDLLILFFNSSFKYFIRSYPLSLRYSSRNYFSNNKICDCLHYCSCFI